MRARLPVVLACFAMLCAVTVAAAAPIPQSLRRYDGTSAAPAATPAALDQMLLDARNAGAALPSPEDLRATAHEAARTDPALVPLAVLDVATEGGRAFAFATLRQTTYRGGDVGFVLDPARWISDGAPVSTLALDAGDGAGFRPLAFGARVHAHYARAGRQVLTLRATRDDGTVLEARAAFEVAALATPSPTDTIHVTASVPFQGVAGTGSGYVDLAPGHTQLVNPVIVIEGFDIDNSMGWDELYALLNRQNMLENLRAMGYDPVVLDFTDATDDMRRNTFVFTTLLQDVEDAIAPGATVAVAGASMGGVIGRYGLAWLESHGIPHRVRTFISFDGPHQGADIPLGIQYWVQFFASQSSDAAFYATQLNRPAARQLLVYHTPVPASGVPTCDSLRTAFLADLAAVGGMPHAPRNVAIANGSGAGIGQGFAPLAELIRWEYNVLLVQIRGDVWAVPSNGSGKIFDGKLFVFGSTNLAQTVTVSGTLPYDGAPGGWRNTMAELDSVQAPFGDIVALYPNHCFVPTISALDLSTGDLFHNCLADPNLLAESPFDTLYVPQTNEEHTSVTAENAAWITNEITRPAAAAVPAFGPRMDAGVALGRPWPMPFGTRVRIPFALSRATHVTLTLHDLAGREVARLVNATLPAGAHEANWDARLPDNRPAPAGIYFARLEADGAQRTTRLVLAR